MVIYSLMVIDNFDVISITSPPNKADPELLIYSDTILPGSTAPQCLQTVARRALDIIQAFCGIEHE